MTHIFRGDSFNGGKHHISALINNPNIQVTHRINKGGGAYKASLRKNGNPPLTMDDKTFFPDDWDELQVIDAIKDVYSKSLKKDDADAVIIGFFNGVAIKIVKIDGVIKTAFPKFP